MARYFFDWRENGTLIQDPVGVECADLDVVRVEASRALRDAVRDIVPSSARRVMVIEVRDGSFNTVLRALLVFERQAPELSATALCLVSSGFHQLAWSSGETSDSVFLRRQREFYSCKRAAFLVERGFTRPRHPGRRSRAMYSRLPPASRNRARRHGDGR